MRKYLKCEMQFYDRTEHKLYEERSFFSENKPVGRICSMRSTGSGRTIEAREGNSPTSPCSDPYTRPTPNGSPGPAGSSSRYGGTMATTASLCSGDPMGVGTRDLERVEGMLRGCGGSDACRAQECNLVDTEGPKGLSLQ